MWEKLFNVLNVKNTHSKLVLILNIQKIDKIYFEQIQKQLIILLQFLIRTHYQPLSDMAVFWDLHIHPLFCADIYEI